MVYTCDANAENWWQNIPIVWILHLWFYENFTYHKILTWQFKKVTLVESLEISPHNSVVHELTLIWKHLQWIPGRWNKTIRKTKMIQIRTYKCVSYLHNTPFLLPHDSMAASNGRFIVLASWINWSLRSICERLRQKICFYISAEYMFLYIGRYKTLHTSGIYRSIVVLVGVKWTYYFTSLFYDPWG